MAKLNDHQHQDDDPNDILSLKRVRKTKSKYKRLVKNFLLIPSTRS